MGNKVGVGEIFRFLKKVGENGKGDPWVKWRNLGIFKIWEGVSVPEPPLFHLLAGINQIGGSSLDRRIIAGPADHRWIGGKPSLDSESNS